MDQKERRAAFMAFLARPSPLHYKNGLWPLILSVLLFVYLSSPMLLVGSSIVVALGFPALPTRYRTTELQPLY